MFFFNISYAEVIQLAYESSKLKIHALPKYVFEANQPWLQNKRLTAY